jgi:hypothetical protein
MEKDTQANTREYDLDDMGNMWRLVRKDNQEFKKQCFENNLNKLDEFLKKNPNYTAKTHFDNRHTHIYKDGKKIHTAYLSKQKFETVLKYIMRLSKK